jgi:hypothetical protein
MTIPPAASDVNNSQYFTSAHTTNKQLCLTMFDSPALQQWHYQTVYTACSDTSEFVNNKL